MTHGHKLGLGCEDGYCSEACSSDEPEIEHFDCCGACEPPCCPCSEPEIELGNDYTRLKPAIKNIAEELLAKPEKPAEPGPDEIYYVWHKYTNCHVAEVVAGLGQGTRVRCPRAHHTPESEIRVKVLHTLKGDFDAAKRRVARARLVCAEVIEHA